MRGRCERVKRDRQDRQTDRQMIMHTIQYHCQIGFTTHRSHRTKGKSWAWFQFIQMERIDFEE